MAELALKERFVRVKIVYYGAPLGGKTSNLTYLHEHAMENRRGEMLSVNSFQDRTILFDLLPLKAVGPRGFEIRLQVVAVPGQPAYALSRRTALKGADGVVFVANSAEDRREDDLQSLAEMHQYLKLHGLDSETMPMVLQYNKRDLPKVRTQEQMDQELNPRRVASWSAVAARGQGVIETFRDILGATMADVARRYRMLGAEFDAEGWAKDAVRTMFPQRSGQPAATSTPVPAPAGLGDLGQASPAAAANHHVLHVPVALSGTRFDSGDERAGQSVAEAYAEACAQLTRAYTDVVGERDALQRRMSELANALTVASDPLSQSVEAWTSRLMACLAEAGEAAQAGFVRWKRNEWPQVLTLPPQRTDALMNDPRGTRLVTGMKDAEYAQLWESAERADVAEVLKDASGSYSAVAVVPVQCAGRPLGAVLLYFLDTDLLPTTDTLTHLSTLARALAAPLQLAYLAESVRQKPQARTSAAGAMLPVAAAC